MTGRVVTASSDGDDPGPARLRAIEGPTPLLAWAAAAWIGALVGWAAAPPVAARSVVVGLGVLTTGAGAVVAVGRTRRRILVPASPPAVARSAGTDRRLVRTVVGVVVVATVAAGGALARAATLDRGPLARLAEQGGAASVEATVASEPTVRDDGTAWVLVTVSRVGVARGRWRALVSGLRDPPAVGARLGATATARPLDHRGFEGSLRRRHVGVELDGAWSRLEPAGGAMGRIDDLRTRIRAAARRGLHGDASALAVGLVTGDTRGLSQDAQDGMQATGLTHLVAVSGSNVALVLGVVAVACRRWPRWARRVLLVAALVGFTVTTRVEPSVLRAAVMAGLVLTCDLRGVPAGGLHALAGTVLVLVLVDPAAAGSLGLVLSALATGGVLVVGPAVARRLPDRLPRFVRLLLAATLGAQLAVAPVLLATVGEVPLVSVPANLVAVPAAAVASVLATIGAVLAPILPGVSGLVFRSAGPPLEVVLAVAERMRGPVVSSAEPVVALVAVGVVVLVAAGGRRLRRIGVVVVIVAVVAWGPPGARLRGRLALPTGVLSVTAIDVGQGDAVLVTTSSGHRMLVDVGGDAAAASWLRRHGIREVDLLVLTHPHADHVGGLPEVAAQVDVAMAWAGVGSDGRPPDLAVVPTSRGPRPTGLDPATEVVAVRAGQHARLGSAMVEVLGPPPAPDLVATEGGDNDRSVVLRVVEGDRVALLTGDAEVAAQQWLLAQADTLAAGLLKVPHHGGATTDPAFLAAVAPRVAVVSVGRDNDYGHPDPRLLAWLADLGVAVHRTDLAGTVTLLVPATAGQERPAPAPSDRGTAGAASTHARPRVARPARGPPGRGVDPGATLAGRWAEPGPAPSGRWVAPGPALFGRWAELGQPTRSRH